MLVSFVITGPGLIPEGGRLLSDSYIVTNEQDQVYMCFIHVFFLLNVKTQEDLWASWEGSVSVLRFPEGWERSHLVTPCP